MTRWLSTITLFLISTNLYGWQHNPSMDLEQKSSFTFDDIQRITERSNLVVFSGDISILSSVFEDVSFSFREEGGVVLGFINTSEIFSKQGDKRIRLDKPIGNSTSNIAVFPKRKKDRSCLSLGALRPPALQGSLYTGPFKSGNMVEFINEKCNSYRHTNGYLTVKGFHRQDILENLFRVEHVSKISMRDIQEHCSKNSCTKPTYLHEQSNLYNQESNRNPEVAHSSASTSHNDIYQCERIEMPSKSVFFHDYLKKSKPVIIKNAINNWPALKKWSNDYFRSNYGDRQVHIKLTPEGIFEGVDFASNFENYDTFYIPEEVNKQLLFPDLVVVRPATKNMNFSDFIDLIESVSSGNTKGISAYLEYSSLTDIETELENDVFEMPFIEGSLNLRHRNIWLSDGKTLGKLHFDPFDNFLCQLSGRKEVTLFSPHNNSQLYEAHIPEANLGYNNITKTFSKKRLVDSTSMVMSPVDLENPNYERFPKFADAHPMNCTISEGEVLFMPAFWWHEVKSYPSHAEKRNLAVNFWYEPFLSKEFPCQECKLDVNPNYRHLL